MMDKVVRKTEGGVTKRTRKFLLAGFACVFALGLCTVLGACQSTSETTDQPAAEEQASTTRMFTDSLGREVEIPAEVTAIAPAGHTANQVLLTMAPEKMVTLSTELTPDQAKYLGKDYANLPVTGAAFGAKGDLNKEAVAAAGAQLLIDTGEIKDGMKEEIDTLQEQLGIPVVMIETKMEDYASAYEKLGELLGMPERGKELSEYCDKAYKDTCAVMEKIPAEKRVKVSYLLGDKGTNTIAKNSYQGQVVDLVAENVADLGKVSGSGAGVEISLEQLTSWDPEVIIFSEDSIYDTVKTDPGFAGLTAIQNDKYYEVPGTPWCWLNGPPTVNQVLGMQWLPRLLYPDQYNDDTYEVVKSYFKTFYNYDLSKEEYQTIAPHAEA